MKLEELKADAAKHGYALVKKREYVRLEPCICGHERRHKERSSRGWYFWCKKCGFTGGQISSSERAARIAWNEAVKREKSGGDVDGYCENIDIYTNR